jgi:hypothetical protein
MFIDGDGRQAPVVMPISDIPLRPENRMIDNLAGVLAALCDDLAPTRTAAASSSPWSAPVATRCCPATGNGPAPWLRHARARGPQCAACI